MVTEPLSPAERRHARRALVELAEPRAEIGGVSGLAGQLAEAAGDLAQRLGPAAGRVGHQRDVEALVAEVLADGDRRIDARLARRDRHVRGVGDDDGAFHERPAGARIGELGELVAAPRPFRCRARRIRRRRSRRRRTIWRASPAGRSCRCRSRPGSAARPPRATGKRVSRMRWPVIIGSSARQARLHGSRDAHRPCLEETDLDESRRGACGCGTGRRRPGSGRPGRCSRRRPKRRRREALLHDAVRGDDAEDRASGRRCRPDFDGGENANSEATASGSPRGRSSPSKMWPSRPGPSRTDSGRPEPSDHVAGLRPVVSS